MQRIGLISDTHGLLRPEAVEFLRGSDQIVHAGDVGGAAILETLAAIAPVTVVRGNVDRGPEAQAWPETALVKIGRVVIYVIHDLNDWKPGAGPAVRAVISGHSHQPRIVERDGVLCVNPGSAGRRRFKLPISVGELLIDGAKITARTADIGSL